MVKIRFKNKEEDAKGFCELAKRIKLICLPNDVYEISEKSLRILDDLKIEYKILEREGFDYVCSKIRNPVASQV
ncbi:MAG: hypothetical protein AB1397_06680 [bacterium]